MFLVTGADADAIRRHQRPRHERTSERPVIQLRPGGTSRTSPTSPETRRPNPCQIKPQSEARRCRPQDATKRFGVPSMDMKTILTSAVIAAVVSGIVTLIGSVLTAAAAERRLRREFRLEFAVEDAARILLEYESIFPVRLCSYSTACMGFRRTNFARCLSVAGPCAFGALRVRSVGVFEREIRVFAIVPWTKSQ